MAARPRAIYGAKEKIVLQLIRQTKPVKAAVNFSLEMALKRGAQSASDGCAFRARGNDYAAGGGRKGGGRAIIHCHNDDTAVQCHCASQTAALAI